TAEKTKTAETSRTQSQKHKIWEIISYNRCDADFIKLKFKEYELYDLIKLLEEHDKGYHMRIDPTKKYIFFGDCDGYRDTFNNFAEILITFLSKYYDIQIEMADISYT